jgi:outer membrane protein assembly factor BamB
VVVQSEGQGDSFAAAFDAATGATRWQIARPRGGSWSSPTLIRRSATAGGDLVLLQSTSGLSAHDPATGRTVWTLATACNDIASTTMAGDTIFLPTSGGIQALRARESVAEPLWTSPKLSFGAASPVVYDRQVYTVNRAGVLNCGDAASGAIVWQLRLKGAIWGSPVIAGGNMYLVNRDGAGLVVRLPPREKDPQAQRRGELIGEGAIDESVLSSPAIADSALYIRSDSHLWKIASK